MMWGGPPWEVLDPFVNRITVNGATHLFSLGLFHFVNTIPKQDRCDFRYRISKRNALQMIISLKNAGK